MAKPLTLRDWINQKGANEVARLLNVNASTVRHWRTGHCLPRTEQMREIKKLSRGAVSYESMIDSHHSNSEE